MLKYLSIAPEGGDLRLREVSENLSHRPFVGRWVLAELFRRNSTDQCRKFRRRRTLHSNGIFARHQSLNPRFVLQMDFQASLASSRRTWCRAVSYTHLTLPTKR